MLDLSYDGPVERYRLGDIIIDMICGNFLFYLGQGSWQIKWSVFSNTSIPNPKLSFADLYQGNSSTAAQGNGPEVGPSLSSRIELLEFQINHLEKQLQIHQRELIFIKSQNPIQNERVIDSVMIKHP